MKHLFFLLIFIYFAQAEVVEEVFYTVNDEVITKMDFDQQKVVFGKSFELQTGELPEDLDAIVISNMIVNKLIEYEAKRNGITVNGLDVTNQIRSIAARNNITSLEQLKVILPQQGMTWEYFFQLQKFQMYREQLEGKLVRVNEPSNGEVKEFYEENKETLFLVKGKMVKLSLIFFQKDSGMTFSEVGKLFEKAQDVHSRIRKNELTFEEAAKKFSDDPSSKPVGGNVGWKIKGDFAVEPSLEAMVFDLKVGEVSDLISSDRGFYICLVREELTDGPMPYEKAFLFVKRILIGQQREKKFEEAMLGIVARAVIKKNTTFFGDYQFR